MPLRKLSLTGRQTICPQAPAAQPLDKLPTSSGQSRCRAYPQSPAIPACLQQYHLAPCVVAYCPSLDHLLKKHICLKDRPGAMSLETVRHSHDRPACRIYRSVPAARVVSKRVWISFPPFEPKDDLAPPPSPARFRPDVRHAVMERPPVTIPVCPGCSGHRTRVDKLRPSPLPKGAVASAEIALRKTWPLLSSWRLERTRRPPRIILPLLLLPSAWHALSAY